MVIHLSGLPGDCRGHPSERPTRRLPQAADEPSCLLLDLAPSGVYLAALVTQRAGALLPHRFTLTCGPSAVCSLWHFPASHLDWLLASTVALGSPDLPRSLRLEAPQRPRPSSQLTVGRQYARQSGVGAPHLVQIGGSRNIHLGSQLVCLRATILARTGKRTVRGGDRRWNCSGRTRQLVGGSIRRSSIR